MRVLVTGAGGFLGRRFLRALQEAGHSALALARPGNPERPAGEAAGTQWTACDLSDPGFQASLPDAADAVVHLAQSRRYRDFPGSAGDIFAVNAGSTLGLLDWACRHGVSKFVYASTGSVYSRGAAPLGEDAPARAPGFYAVSKRVGEQLCEAYQDRLDTVVLRFFTLYGPGQKDRLVPGLAAKIRNGEPVNLAGPDGVRMSYLHVDDAAAILLKSLGLKGPHLLNAAGPEPASIRELSALIGRALGTEPRFAPPGPPEGDLVADIGRMRKVLGYIPPTSLEKGLAGTVRGA